MGDFDSRAGSHRRDNSQPGVVLNRLNYCEASEGLVYGKKKVLRRTPAILMNDYASQHGMTYMFRSPDSSGFLNALFKSLL